MRRAAVPLLIFAALAALAGCGGGSGVSSGARLTVYISAPLHGEEAAAGRALCTGARQALARAGGRAGSLRVRAVCLDDSGGAQGWSLAAVGADARRTAEDSTSVGYIGELEPGATRFSRPILAAAGIAQVAGRSGRAAMAALLRAIAKAGPSGAVRERVRATISRQR